MVNYRYIIVEGNIGSGKTTLSTLLAKDLNAKLILEEFSENPFLPKFYENKDKYAFPLELSFLAERYHQLKNEINSYDLFKEIVVSDYYFSKSLLFAKETLAKDELDLYNNLYKIIYTSLPKPDLYIYLYSDIEKLKSNIEKRGRDYEQNIDPQYLKRIQETYLAYIQQQKEFPVLLVDNTSLDFINNPKDLEKIKDLFKLNWEIGLHRVKLD